MDKAFTYAETNAITTEEAYPYVPKHSSCDTARGSRRYQISPAAEQRHNISHAMAVS